MQNNKVSAGKCLLPLLLLFLLLPPLLAQTSTAQPTEPQQDKALSFLRDVIQLDVDHYKISLTTENTNTETLYLTYSAEPKTFLSLEESQILNFQFYNGSLTSFGILRPGSGLVFTQPRPDHFNETLDILERYQDWLADPQVGEMAALLRQVGSELNIFQVSGNLSLKIQGQTNNAEYRFSNYINGVEYSGISITQSSTGAIFFADSRASQPIGDTTIGISEDQAIAIAQNYVATHPFRGNVGASKEIGNLNITGIKAVVLKSGLRANHTLYPYYDVQFTVENPPSYAIGDSGVNVGAKDGEIWHSYSSYSSTNTPHMGSYNILVIVIITVLCCAAIIIGVYKSRLRFNVNPKTV